MVGWLLIPFQAIVLSTTGSYVDESEQLERHEFAQPRLNRVRDIFLFSAYTGLHYSDAMTLTLDNIVTGVDGNL